MVACFTDDVKVALLVVMSESSNEHSAEHTGRRVLSESEVKDRIRSTGWNIQERKKGKGPFKISKRISGAVYELLDLPEAHEGSAGILVGEDEGHTSVIMAGSELTEADMAMQEGIDGLIEAARQTVARQKELLDS
ncbi:hypothetical protein EXS54_01900 [Patescibacteria group bacterium]|nr:hypothetical protein [Patescibacteria group bacterium]